MSGVIEVGYSASINTPDYVLEEDKSNNSIQITAQNDGTSGTCVLTQNESGNKINLHLTTPEEKEYWEIRFNPNYNLPSNSYFTTKTTGLGSYTLTKVSTPSASSDTPILSSRFNPTKKYPLDLNFYWVITST